MKIIWSIPSFLDLDNIKNYIKKDSIYYANSFICKIINFTEKLENFPEIGRIVPEYNNKELKEIIYKNYRIIYKIDYNKKNIYILAIIHASRDLKKVIENLEDSI